MKRRVFCRLIADAPPSRFITRAGSGWTEIGSPQAGDEVIVFVPGTEVLATQASFGARLTRDMERAAAFAVEDELAAPPESVRAIVGERQSERARRPVFVVSAARLQAWQTLLAGAALDHARLVPDFSVLAPDTSADFGDLICVRAEERMFTLEKSWPDDVLRVLLGTLSPPTVADPLRYLAEFASDQKELADFGHGASRSDTTGALAELRIGHLMLLAGLLAAALVSESVLSGLAQQRLASSVRAKAEAIYVAANPQGVLPLAVPARAGRAPAANAASFRELTALLLNAMDTVQTARLLALRYDRETGHLNATLLYAQFGDDEALRAALAAQGVQADLGEARAEPRGVFGELTVRQGP